MTPEERKAAEDKKQSLVVKEQGNAHYTKKEFAQAIQKYSEAVALDPTNPTFHTNLAAVHLAQRHYDDCISACETALKVAEENGIHDFSFKARCYLRIGNANLQKKEYEAAVAAYDLSLFEEKSREAAQNRAKAINKGAEKKRRDYLDPVKAQEAKALGNSLFAENKFPAAIDAYTEAINRDPSNPNATHVFYSNRANCYAKLMSFGSALADCESCIKLNPRFTKIYIRKGKILHLQKRYKEAIDAFDAGLALEPTSSELIQGKRATMIKIQEENMTGNVDPERQARAMNDVEIQQIMRDPVISNVLQALQTDPAAGQRAMQDPNIAAKINKLIQAGILRTQ